MQWEIINDPDFLLPSLSRQYFLVRLQSIVMVFGLLFYWRLSVFQYCWLESWQSWLFCQLRNSAPSKTQARQNTLITTFTTLYLAGPDTSEGSWRGQRITDEPVSECQDISIENWHKLLLASSSLWYFNTSAFTFP